MKSRFTLINSGLYPETLPPCFVSIDSQRAFRGLVGHLDDTRFNSRKTHFTRYSGTKHDGSRRFFGTPNIVSYFHVSSFIWKNWSKFQSIFSLSNFSIGAPNVLDSDERAIKVPSLSELSKHSSTKLGHAPYILKVDIAQCFPSIYTHSISWAVHGIEQSKIKTDERSKDNYFNALDFFTRNCQQGNSRGVLIGPDAFRLIVELVLSRLDNQLSDVIGNKIVGAVRHVDDYYIGLRTEHNSQSVLSMVREILSGYELYLNDHKTRIYPSIEPINDIWAQRLRKLTNNLSSYSPINEIEFAIDKSLEAARVVGSDSPVKILLRALDENKIYNSRNWDFVDKNLQRIVQHYPHAIDYVCLLVAKRVAIGGEIDSRGWLSVSTTLIHRNLALNHEHEVLWMTWLLIVCKLPFSPDIAEALAKSRNGHIRALLAQAFVDGAISRKPKLGIGQALPTTEADWLLSLVARSQGYSKAKFSGLYAQEFEHLASRSINLIDFKDHLDRIRPKDKPAISRRRYGYDDTDDSDHSYQRYLQELDAAEENPY